MTAEVGARAVSVCMPHVHVFLSLFGPHGRVSFARPLSVFVPARLCTVAIAIRGRRAVREVAPISTVPASERDVVERTLVLARRKVSFVARRFGGLPNALPPVSPCHLRWEQNQRAHYNTTANKWPARIRFRLLRLVRGARERKFAFSRIELRAKRYYQPCLTLSLTASRSAVWKHLLGKRKNCAFDSLAISFS